MASLRRCAAIKSEAMLAVGLRREGWRVRILLRNRNDRWAIRYFRAFGLDDFVYWSDYRPTPDDLDVCRKAEMDYLSREFTFHTIKSWEFEGAWIGPQILASVSRSDRQGSIEPTETETKNKILNWLPKTLRTVRVASQIMEDVRPRMMYVMEPNYAKNGPLTDKAIAMGVDVIRIAGVARDNTIMLRRLTRETRREHPSTVSHRTMEEFKLEPWTDDHEREWAEVMKARYDGSWFLQQRNQLNAETWTRDAIIREVGLDPEKKTGVVFSHVLWDANLFYGEDLFSDYGDWFVQTVRAAAANPAVNWIIKLHPANVWKRHREGATDELSEVVLLRQNGMAVESLPAHVKVLPPDTKIGTDSLVQVTDYGITVRGTVSAELPCLGNPVFTAGTGRCHGFGFTHDSSTKEEYLHKLATIQNYGRLSEEEILLAKRFAQGVFCRRPWMMKSFRMEFFVDPRGRHPLDYNIKTRVGSWKEVEAHGDLKKWADWAADTGRVDYLDH
jgi:hypothetical protein